MSQDLTPSDKALARPAVGRGVLVLLGLLGAGTLATIFILLAAVSMATRISIS